MNTLLHTLRVRGAEGDFEMPVSSVQSVRDALAATPLRVRAACGGAGQCGACLVTVLSGDVTPPTVLECTRINMERLSAGERLACQLRLVGDAEILLKQPAWLAAWTSMPRPDLDGSASCRDDLSSHAFGVAVDLGTTHIRVALWNRREGRHIASRWGPNPQCVFGADVLSRLGAARDQRGRAEELAELVRAAVVEALRDILQRELGSVQAGLGDIGQVVIVGNTAMLALLTGRGGAELVDPDNWQRRIECAPADPAGWRAEWDLPHAEIVVVPPMAGFVGSDLSADLLASCLREGPAPALLLDVGTNTEVALWDGQHLWVTSAPGGPAFEGSGVRCGMAAEAGAISAANFESQTGVFACDVIGGGTAKGICGSGLVDVVAGLLRAGHVKPSGRFAEGVAHSVRLDRENADLAITSADVDAFQRAKAATAAAMMELLGRAGLHWSVLKRLCICGAFGRRLNVRNAQAIGLLPLLDPGRVELHGDASLAGCERLLLNPDGVGLLAGLSEFVRPMNLSLTAGYEERYVDHLRLRPIAPSSE